MEKIKKYVRGLTNLYGVVSESVILEIFNNQNKDHIAVDDLQPLIAFYSEKNRVFVRYRKGYFVHEAIHSEETINYVLAQRRGKPRYTPDRKVIYQYVDEYFVEPSEEFDEMIQFLHNEFDLNEEKAKKLSEDLYYSHRLNKPLEFQMNKLKYYDVRFLNDYLLHRFIRVYNNFANTVRVWENYGCKPKDLFHFEFQKLSKDVTPVTQTREVGRNERCPCGSGKKYKMCCLKSN